MENEEKNEQEDLYIPVNCSPLDYVIEGFTKTDITWIGASVLIGFIICIWSYMKYGNALPGVMISAVLVAIAILFVKRDKCGENTIDRIKLFKDFKKSVKIYVYKYKNPYEILEEGETDASAN